MTAHTGTISRISSETALQPRKERVAWPILIRMNGDTTPTYLQEVRRARARHNLALAGRLVAFVGGVVVTVVLALAGIGYLYA